ncbi:hypothetical protein KIN20_005052 [Parelaphostrongylus tenuis]|uniref:Neurotransmitter-gated ion-channel transmembrane domain-containing protein n=1 Tax=Parelaphostrongylus tenuis TaxID=148309 RepID=A0AAD5MIA1_PARTN|nr:hypothetical protein KIN20_005052 [Parelaphostrongylus tenuis]
MLCRRCGFYKKQFQKTVFEIEMATKNKKEAMPTVNSLFLGLPMLNRSKSVKPDTTSAIMADKLNRKRSTYIGRTFDRNMKPSWSGSSVRDKLRRAEQNVQYIAQTLTERRQGEELEADWQFVSLVIDRILLVIFAFTITAGTLVTVLSAPSITDTREPISATQSFNM